MARFITPGFFYAHKTRKRTHFQPNPTNTEIIFRVNVERNAFVHFDIRTYLWRRRLFLTLFHEIDLVNGWFAWSRSNRNGRGPAGPGENAV